MTKEKIAQDSYRRLIYFYENEIKIHFKDFNDVWYNGLILDLNSETKTMVLKENVRGTIPMGLEDVNPDTIVKFVPKEEEVGE